MPPAPAPPPSSAPAAHDPAKVTRAFRDALGAFATGVTIATTTDAGGDPVGMTASSFNSVSLDPPLVLWSLAKSAQSRAAFTGSGHFAVHVLAASQQDLSDRFARSGTDKFAGLAWQKGALGSPVLADFAARFECRTRHEYEGGDHVILVGEVVAFEAHDVPPLLFHAGGYARRRLQGGKVTVLDVRQPGEWQQGHIDPALHVPLGDLEERIAEVPTTGTVAVICRTSNRSASGISILRRAGRDNVVHVLGGMSQWGAATGGCATTACATTPTAVGSNSKGGTR